MTEYQKTIAEIKRHWETETTQPTKFSKDVRIAMFEAGDEMSLNPDLNKFYSEVYKKVKEYNKLEN